MQIGNLLQQAVKQGASDIFIIAGRMLGLKINGNIEAVGEEKLNAEDSKHLLRQIYTVAGRNIVPFEREGDDDFSFAINKVGRFRVNAYKQRGSLAAVIRVVSFELPNEKELNIPNKILKIYKEKKGLILITGPAGSGKSTTLACIIHQMNLKCDSHIITLEDPIEFIHAHEKSIVSQREINSDTSSYIRGLTAALREAPDVILLGEMRDSEIIQTAMTAAETGQLILSTLHTLGAANTINRIIDVFPPSQQCQIRIQLAMVLKAVISQQLVETKDHKLRPVFEIMFVNNAIRNLIRDAKIHQIEAIIQLSKKEGMQTMDTELLELYRKNRIDKYEVIRCAVNREGIQSKLE